jgi:hypothetical protein
MFVEMPASTARQFDAAGCLTGESIYLWRDQLLELLLAIGGMTRSPIPKAAHIASE